MPEKVLAQPLALEQVAGQPKALLEALGFGFSCDHCDPLIGRQNEAQKEDLRIEVAVSRQRWALATQAVMKCRLSSTGDTPGTLQIPMELKTPHHWAPQ